MPSSMEPILIMADVLADAAEETLRQMARLRPVRPRPSRGATRRPGPDTPHWMALVEAVRPHLKQRGEQAKLARILGVPRQRVHEYFIAAKTFPDAEGVLLTLYWLAARRAGKSIG